MKRWKKQELKWLIENYPSKGKVFCATYLKRTEGAIRQKTSDLKLKSNFKFNSISNYNRGSGWRGRKREEHSEWLKKYHPLKGTHCSNTTKKKISDKIKIAVKDGRVRVDNFRGCHHTKESKKKIRISNTGRAVSQETINKTLATKLRKYGYYHKNTENTYSRCKRGWYDIGGKKMYFRSLWEANYALYLNFLKRRNDIRDWGYEVDTFWFLNIKRGVRSYKPDFKIFNNDGTIEYHEVKGWMDAKSKTKIKRMSKYYPKIKLEIIGQSVYKDLKNKLGKLLKFYETNTDKT